MQEDIVPAQTLLLLQIQETLGEVYQLGLPGVTLHEAAISLTNFTSVLPDSKIVICFMLPLFQAFNFYPKKRVICDKIKFETKHCNGSNSVLMGLNSVKYGQISLNLLNFSQLTKFTNNNGPKRVLKKYDKLQTGVFLE